jgi:hypothetical protein
MGAPGGYPDLGERFQVGEEGVPASEEVFSLSLARRGTPVCREGSK